MTSSLTTSPTVTRPCRIAGTLDNELSIAEFEEADNIGEGSDDSFDAEEEALTSCCYSSAGNKDICTNYCRFCSVGFDTTAQLHNHLLEVHETASHVRDSEEEFYSDTSSHGSHGSIHGLQGGIFTGFDGPVGAEASEILVGETLTVVISEAEHEQYDHDRIIAATDELALTQATITSILEEQSSGCHEQSAMPTPAPATALTELDNSKRTPLEREQHKIVPPATSSAVSATSFDHNQPVLEAVAFLNDVVETKETNSTIPPPGSRSGPPREKSDLMMEAKTAKLASIYSISSSQTMSHEEVDLSPKYMSVTPSSATCLRYVKICKDHKSSRSHYISTINLSNGHKKCFIDARYAGSAKASLLAFAAQGEWVELPLSSLAAKEPGDYAEDDDDSSEVEIPEEHAVFNDTANKAETRDYEQHIRVIWLADGFVFSHLHKCLRTQESPVHERNAIVSKHVWLNHFPGASQDVHKATLSKELNRLRSLLKETQPSAGSMDFYPRTFLLPADEAAAVSFLKPNLAFLDDMQESKPSAMRTLIVKPSKGSQGKGIRLIQHPRAVRDHAKAAAAEMKESASDEDYLICQEYLARPLTLGGLKVNCIHISLDIESMYRPRIDLFISFTTITLLPHSSYQFDLRLYLLVVASSDMNEPDAWLCREGLARFATTSYRPPSATNLSQPYMHLTNYSLNKDSSKFNLERHKRPLSSVLSELVDTLAVDDTDIWNELSRIAAHTLMAITPSLVNSRRAFAAEQQKDAQSPGANQLPNCFQIFGLDVMLAYDDDITDDSGGADAAEKASCANACLDSNARKRKRRVKASLLEVNANPAMSTTAGPEAAPSAVDVAVKGLALRGALHCVKDWDQRRSRAPQQTQWWKHGSLPVPDDVNSSEDGELVGYMRVATAGRWCGPLKQQERGEEEEEDEHQHQHQQQDQEQQQDQVLVFCEGILDGSRTAEEPAFASVDAGGATATVGAREEMEKRAAQFSGLADDAAVMRCGDMLDEARRLFEAFAEAPAAVQASVVDGIKTSQHQERENQRRRARPTSAFWAPATARGVGGAHSTVHAHCTAKTGAIALPPTPEARQRNRRPQLKSSASKTIKSKPSSAVVPSYLDLVTSHVHAPCNEPVFRLNKAQFVGLAKACLPLLREPDSSGNMRLVTSSPSTYSDTCITNCNCNPWLSALTTRSLEALYDDATRGWSSSRAKREPTSLVGAAALSPGGSFRASGVKRGTPVHGQATSPGGRTTPPSSAPSALPHEGSMSFSACLDALGRLASALRDTSSTSPSRQRKANQTTMLEKAKEASSRGQSPKAKEGGKHRQAPAPLDTLSLDGFIARAAKCLWAAARKQVE